MVICRVIRKVFVGRLVLGGLSLLFLVGALFLLAYPGIVMETPFYFLRLSRVFMAFLIGSGLSLTAWFFQSITRNPLTSEYTLGVSAAATFFAGLGFLLGFSSLTWGVMGGVGFSFFLFFVLFKKLSSNALILLGIAFNIFFSSGLMFFNYLTSFKISQNLSRWIFGGFSFYQPHELFLVFMVFLLLIVALFYFAPKIILISVSEIYEEILHKNFKKAFMVLVFLSGVFISLASAYAGPIPFFALLWAHLGRKIFKGNPFKTLIFCGAGGGFILALLDSLSRMINPIEEIPVGISVALFSLPFLFFILLKEKP